MISACGEGADDWANQRPALDTTSFPRATDEADFVSAWVGASEEGLPHHALQNARCVPRDFSRNARKFPEILYPSRGKLERGSVTERPPSGLLLVRGSYRGFES